MIRRNAATIDLDALAANFAQLQRAAGPGNHAGAVVKANAYGHGLLPVARTCAAAGARYLGVATLDEALALRADGIEADILVHAPLLPEDAPDAAAHRLTPFVSSLDFLDALGRTGAPTRCCIALDTGMGREGLSAPEARTAFDRAAPSVRIVGVSTHLSSADEDDPAPTDAQCAAFDAFVRALGPRADGLWRSSQNSPGILRARRPDGVCLTRPGALLYGISPCAGALDAAGVVPVLTWQARILLLRELPAGATVGYGRTATLTRPTRIATLGAGYGDGLSRGLSNRGFALVHGRRCPILGRVSMDQTQVDVTDADGVRLGDTATLLGGDGPSADAMARLLDTTCHEPTTALSARVERLYRRNGRISTEGELHRP